MQACETETSLAAAAFEDVRFSKEIHAEVSEAIEKFNAIPHVARYRALEPTPETKRVFAERKKQFGLAEIHRAIDAISNSKFWKSATESGGRAKRRIGFDKMLEEKTFTTAIEGGYDEVFDFSRKSSQPEVYKNMSNLEYVQDYYDYHGKLPEGCEEYADAIRRA